MTRNLRVIRESKGMSRSALSRDTGISTSTIWKYETGKSEMLKPLLKKLAEYFNTTVEALAIEIIEAKVENIKTKSCLNQRCLLNKNCFCQSERVIEGEYCQNEDLVSDKTKKVKYNPTNVLFV